MINKEWSKEQNNRTKEILKNRDVVAFTFDWSRKNKGCTLNHLDGRYGYIKLKDAIKNNYTIYDYETDELLGTYDSIDEVISNGWKVSS